MSDPLASPDQPAPSPSIDPVSGTDRLAATIERLEPQLQFMAKAYAKHVRDNLFWQWVKRLAATLALLVMFLVYVANTAGIFGYQPSLSKPGVVLIDISGAIGPSNLASGDRVVPLIESACASKYTEALVLRINSPGGAPADAERIGAAVDRCKTFKNQPGKTRRVLAIIDGVGASAGYMIALHADDIAANSMALVGSIGVIMSGLQFEGALQKVGAQSREYATGANKGAFSPYREDTPEQARYAQDLVDSAMVEFKNLVIARRPGLDTSNPELFSGRVWTANRAEELGLIDEVAVLEDILEREFPDMPRQLVRPRRNLQETMQLDTWVNAFETAIRGQSDFRLQ